MKRALSGSKHPYRRLGAPEDWVSCGREDAQISRFGTRLRPWQRGRTAGICMLLSAGWAAWREADKVWRSAGRHETLPDGAEARGLGYRRGSCPLRPAAPALGGSPLMGPIWSTILPRVCRPATRPNASRTWPTARPPRPAGVAGRRRPGGRVPPAAAGRCGRRTIRP